MYFALMCHDKPGALQVRMDTRPDHVEGANAAIAACALSNRENIILPITNSVADIIEGRLDVAQAIQELLARPLRQEQE